MKIRLYCGIVCVAASIPNLYHVGWHGYLSWFSLTIGAMLIATAPQQLLKIQHTTSPRDNPEVMAILARCQGLVAGLDSNPDQPLRNFGESISVIKYNLKNFKL